MPDGWACIGVGELKWWVMMNWEMWDVARGVCGGVSSEGLIASVI